MIIYNAMKYRDIIIIQVYIVEQFKDRCTAGSRSGTTPPVQSQISKPHHTGLGLKIFAPKPHR